MSTLPDIKALIIDLIGQGVLDVTLRALFTERSPSLVAGDLDEALLELQRQSVIIGAGGCDTQGMRKSWSIPTQKSWSSCLIQGSSWRLMSTS